MLDSDVARMRELPSGFPFRTDFQEFLTDYAACSTYWYVPKARALHDRNVRAAQRIMNVILDDFLDVVWNPEIQDRLLQTLAQRGAFEPHSQGGTLADRTALVRIWKKLLETLGFLFVQDDREVVITDAGLDFIVAEDPRPIVEGQIAKLQYPAPTLTGTYRDDFAGILPHLFLLQVLRNCDYRLTYEEYELFVNLARAQDGAPRVAHFIACWRDLSREEQLTLLTILGSVPMAGAQGHTRMTRLRLSRSYQLSFYTYPSYLRLEQTDDHTCIVCDTPGQIDDLVDSRLGALKVTLFDSVEDWFAYFGDPKQQPSWFTYLVHETENAPTREVAEEVAEEHEEHLTREEANEIQRKQVEKGIETFYVDNLPLLEEGLALVEGGRQYSTPIGRIDLFCRSAGGEYVIVEIKADDATDSAFGQILRYIGWVHRNLPQGRSNVRGIILAGRFPESARYSRIGLLRDDHRRFLRFKTHGLYATDT